MSRPAALHVSNAPSPRLVFAYIGLGLLSFLFLGAWTAFSSAAWGGFYASPRLLAWVHVAVLLWLNLVIFGVLFQFVPVVLNVRLGSEKLAWAQLAFYVPGAIGMTVSFWIGRLDWPLHAFASVLWLGFFLFIWNMLVTYREVKEWTLTARCIYAAVMHLLATIMLGLFLSIHLAYPMGGIPHLTLLKLHAHFGIVGWLLMLVMGISQKLLPMFLLSHNYSTKPGEIAFYLVNAGLLSWSVAVLLDASWALQAVFAGVLGAGIFCYLGQAVLLFRARNKVRSDSHRRKSVRKIEFQLRFAGVAFGVLALVVLLGCGIAALRPVLPGELVNRLILVYGAAIFLGFFSLLTQAFLYKIVPFLVWIEKFRDTAGRVKPPKIEAMIPRASAIAQLSTYCIGAALSIAALGFDFLPLIGVGAGLLFASGIWLSVNLAVVWKRAVPVGAILSARSSQEQQLETTNEHK